MTSRLRPGATILDIGCGSGRDLLWFREYGFKPTGFEVSPSLARLAEDHSGCPVIVDDFSSYDFSVHSFDALVFVGSLVHLYEAEFPEVIARVSRAMKDTGKMYLTLKEGEGMAQRPDGRLDTLWTAEGLENIFSDQGFAVLDSSRNISVMGTGDAWLAYLLTFNGGG